MLRLGLISAVAGLALLSCARGISESGQDVLSPPITNAERLSNVSNASLWGIWNVSIDPDSEAVSAVPLRGIDFTCNVIKFINQSPGNLKFANLTKNIQGNHIYIGIDIGLTHPLPGQDVFIGFDVLGVFLGDQGSGDDFVMLNEDGYTRWFNAPEFAKAGSILKLVGYYPGAQGTAGFTPDGYLNPYKYFADGLGTNDDEFAFLVANGPGRGAFRPGSLNWRHYELRRPLSQPPSFQYAVIAHWEPNAKHPKPPSSLLDFPPSANADEAVVLSVVDSSSLYYSPGNSGGTISLNISPFDWSADCSSGMGEYQIECYSPLYGPLLVDMTPVGSGPHYCTFHAQKTLTGLDSADPVRIVIQVIYPGLDYSNPFGVSNDTVGPLVSTFDVDVPVGPPPPEITVLKPNGGEVWYVGANGEIKWESSPGITQVDIEYSKDDFVSDVNLIAANEMNDGIYTWHSIPNDPTTSAKVRVSSSANPLVSDVSDEPFTIAAPDCTPEDHFETEPNDSSAAAVAMQWDYAPEADGFTHTGQTCPNGDVDWYSFEITSGQGGSFLVSCFDITESESLDIELLDASGNILDQSILMSGHVAQTVRIPVPSEPGTYYLKITATANIHEYDIHPLRWPSWNEGFTFFETEPNETWQSADAMPLSYDPDSDAIQYTGEQTGWGDDDWYSFNVPSSGVIAVHMVDYDNASNEEEYITLYDAALNHLDSSKIWYQDGSTFVRSNTAVPAGTYYVLVTANTFTHRYVLEPDLLSE